MILRICIFLVVSYFAASAFAEYRVFNLRIEKIANPEEFREVISNLDPQQYRGFNPIQQDERIHYTATWMCWGRTSQHKKLCDPPERTLASDETGGGDATAGPDLQTVPVPTSVEKSLQP